MAMVSWGYSRLSNIDFSETKAVQSLPEEWIKFESF
jgi:hypothetical protein